MLPSSVQRDRDDERARLRILEEVEALREELGAAEVGLGVEALVLGPRVEIAAGDANQRAADAEVRTHPRLVSRVSQRQLAPLHEAAILDELRLRAAGAATGRCEPRLIIRERVERDLAGARTSDRFTGQHVLSKDAVRLANVGLRGRAEPVERGA